MKAFFEKQSSKVYQNVIILKTQEKHVTLAQRNIFPYDKRRKMRKGLECLMNRHISGSPTPNPLAEHLHFLS